MKVSDLMLGDWVNVNGLNLKVGAIHADEIGVFDPDYKIYWCSDDGLDRIDPIPLTESILVKNGFEKQGDLYQYHINAGNGYTRINIIDLQDGVWSYDIDVYDKFADAHKIHHDDDCFLKLHQLQQLLRLCGIEKELIID